MLDLLPGDRLWNRYRVESVAAYGAWLTRLREPAESPKAPHNFFLLALERQPGLAPLPELLSLAGTAVPLQAGRMVRAPSPAGAPGPASAGRRSAVPGAVGNASAFQQLPLLGAVAWVGAPARGGMALVEVPPSEPLPELLAASGPLAAAAVLPLLEGLAAEILAFLEAVDVPPQDSPAHLAMMRCLARILNPGAIVLFSGPAHLGIRMALPEPALDLAPPRWAEFLAPELYRGEALPQAACVFGVARLGAYLLGVVDAPLAEPEPAWTALADWACGRRDPADECLQHPGAAQVPPELRSLLASCLARAPGSRPASLRELHSALKLLEDCSWNKGATRCKNCGFVTAAGAPVPACPCCGRKAEVAEAGKPAPAIAAEAVAAAKLENMSLVPSGVFLSGDQKTPRMLRAYAIDSLPVTEGDYKRYLSKVMRPPRPEGPGSRPREFDNHPVTSITWYEANEYAEFYGKRLPTIHEWEKAARGTDGRKYPFGNEFKTAAVPRKGAGGKDGETRGTMPVGSRPAGASPYGVLDLAGNVLEWTSTARRAGQRLFRAVKGSCLLDGSQELARCASVQYLGPESAEPFVGFRCVKDVE